VLSEALRADRLSLDWEKRYLRVGPVFFEALRADPFPSRGERYLRVGPEMCTFDKCQVVGGLVWS
jgi:hypothetical protein